MYSVSSPYLRQALALLPGWLIMLAGGMHLAYGVFNIFGYFTWVERSALALYFIPASFHMTTIIGATVASLIYNKFDIFKIHFVNCALILIASIVAIAVPKAYLGVLLSRVIFGLGFGSSYVGSIIHASEVSSPDARALFTYLHHLFLTLGMFIFSVFTLSINFFIIPRLIGSFSAGFVLLSAGVALLTLKSSDIFLMQTNSKDALERFQFFQGDSAENRHIESEATQSFIIEEKKRSFNFFGRHNMSALIVILFLGIGHVSVFNALHNFYRAVYLSAYLTAGARNYSLMIMMAARLIGCIVGFFVLDRIAKKLQYFISALIVSLLLFSFGTFVYVDANPSIWMPMLFFIPLEFMVGVGLSPIADILKGELFPLKEKPISIATAIAFIEVLHCVSLIFLHTWIFSLGSFTIPRVLPFVFGGLTLFCSIAVFLFLEDSRKESLRIVSNLYSSNQQTPKSSDASRTVTLRRVDDLHPSTA